MTKKQSMWAIAAAVACASQAWGQQLPKGTPDANRLEPRTGTFYVNTSETLNNTKTESLGVGVAANGNVLIAWEDDGDGLKDIEAVWTMYSAGGVSISEAKDLKSLSGEILNSKFYSFFRKDGSPTPGNTAWGPKVKANLFGDGIGMGATAYDLGNEVPEFEAINDNGGSHSDFPAVQLLDNSGNPVRILSYSDADADPAGNIRIADWDYLANGNIVIVGESRQNDDLVSVFGGTAPAKHVTYKVLDSTGKEIKKLSLASATTDANELWHGAAVTKNGFAIRLNQGGRTLVRLFDNSGNPTSTNIDMGNLTGKTLPAGGGRGDNKGFHGNGVDGYVFANSGTAEDGNLRVWITVLGDNGKIRYSVSASDDVDLTSVGGVDVALDASGKAFVVYEAKVSGGSDYSLILGRMLDGAGKPIGGTFYVSEKETPDTAAGNASGPRVATRNDAFAVIWQSKTSELDQGINVVAGRFFGVAYQPGTIESVGLKRIVADTPIINPNLDALGNWEPNASMVGGNRFLIEGNTFADGSTSEQRFVVMVQPSAGGAGKLVEGFYTDKGVPFKGVINASRQNGNPGRVAGDARPGAVNYIVGAEASPHLLLEFNTDNRWNLGFDRLGDGRYGTVQIYSLNDSLTPTPLSKALDSAHGRRTSGDPQGNNQISRFGGDMVCLDNGNFVSVVEDRSKVLNPTGNAAVATIFTPAGGIVKEAFVVANGDLWSNVAVYSGGFAVRVAGVIYFFNNAGELQGQADQDTTSGDKFDRGRGDGTRLAGHVNNPYVFLAGKVTTGNIVKVAVWDARDRKFVGSAEVSEAGFAGNFDRVNLAVDALNRITVGWVSQPAGYEQQQVATRVLALNTATKTITPITKSFLPFINAAQTGGIRTIQMTLAMTTKEIMVAAKGEINLQNRPESGANSNRELNFYTVFTHPDPKSDPTVPVGGFVASTIKKISNSGTTVTIEWDGSATLQSSDKVSGGTWTDITTAKSPYNTSASGSAKFFRLKN